jgi:hypothetical protein
VRENVSNFLIRPTRFRPIHQRVSEKDLMVKADHLRGGTSKEIEELDNSAMCSICLEGFVVGDAAAHASNKNCPHVFHEKCILSWLVARQDPLCPCCRQQFTVINKLSSRTPQTSIVSQDFVSGLGGESDPQSTISDNIIEDLEAGQCKAQEGGEQQQDNSTIPIPSDSPD